MKNILKNNIFNIVLIFCLLIIIFLLIAIFRLNIIKFHIDEEYKTMVKEEYQTVSDDYDKYIRFNPFDLTAYANRGIANYKKGSYEKALKDFQFYLHFKKNPEVYRYLGNIYSTYDMNYAIRIFSEGLKHFPCHSDLLNNRAYVKFLNGNDLKDALEDVNKSLAISPRAYSYHTRAEIYRNMGLYENALSDSAQGIKLNEYGTPYCYCEKGYNLVNLGRVQQAQESLKMCKKLSEDLSDFKYREMYEKYLK